MKYLTAITITVFLAAPSTTVSSRCAELSVRQAFEQAKSVFVGEVVSVEDPGLAPDDSLIFDLVRPIKVHFLIKHIYSGSVTKEIVIATQSGGVEFGYKFKLGEKYLVYAQNGNQETELVVKGCGRSRRVEDATEDLGTLENIAPRKSNLRVDVSRRNCMLNTWKRL